LPIREKNHLTLAPIVHQNNIPNKAIFPMTARKKEKFLAAIFMNELAARINLDGGKKPEARAITQWRDH
jgi:hypothetical protein